MIPIDISRNMVFAGTSLNMHENLEQYIDQDIVMFNANDIPPASNSNTRPRSKPALPLRSILILPPPVFLMQSHLITLRRQQL